MKTITEFSGFTLKEAVSKKAALLTEGKTEEEAQAAINEILKLDEAKAPFYKNAVDMTGSRIDRVKRVVVALKGSETEKVPDAFMEREGHFYLVEFFPQAQEKGARKEESASYHDDFARGRTGGGRGRGGPGGDRGRDGGRGRGPGSDRDRNAGGRGHPPREQRPSNGVRFDGAPHSPMPANNDKAARGRPPRQPRGERKPRPPRDPNAAPRAPRGPKGAGELRLVLKGQAPTTLAGSGPATAVPAPAAEAAAPSTES
ncbi:MAG: hypothetical protein JST80_00895 [Bdellovibrionales bacterium]|nr:hypothetical protein [Bdellovibrionales bacterium]